MKQKYLYIFSVILVGLTYTLISLGGLVRSAGAGLACPDWPFCYGQMVPRQMLSQQVLAQPGLFTGYQIFLEWFHRLMAGGVSVLLIVLAFFIFRDKTLRKASGKPVILAFVLLAAQIILGGLTVLGLLDSKWVASHLAVGLAFFCSTLWIMKKVTGIFSPRQCVNTVARHATHLKDDRKIDAPSGGKDACHLIVFAQALLGGLVSSNHAGLACPDFPTCNGMWWPELTWLVKLQFIHRIGAVVTTVALVWFTYRAMRETKKRKSSTMTRFGILSLPFFLLLQILLGAGMIFMKLPLLMSVAHLAVATALIGTVFVITYDLKYNSRT